ncbi:Universal stress protein [Hyphomicrobiales bacterium]|nr:Universal stress protein [Hyphomicrobiales bacterium]CAH1699118.1 TusA-related sulfurtransferase [Hyphomicrobiales bacterium]CAI0342908.1 Universal stress protein [Hyphomicrobiales bacterium]
MSISEALPIRELDVRPMLRAGEEPFQAIMQAVSALAPGESLRLVAPFRPVPLFSVMANRGFAARDRALGGGDWEVVFSPVDSLREEDAQDSAGLALGSSPSAVFWGDPAIELDLIELEPPEPMVRILEALEGLQPGDVLFALLAREPVFLFPELAKRQHEWAGNFDASGTAYRLLVRHGGGRTHG